MKLLRILYLLFAVILFGHSCSYTNEQLLQAEQLIETSPDSAMAILQKYNYNSLTDRDKALYGLLYVQILDKKQIDISIDTLLNFSTNYYNAHEKSEYLARCYLYMGRVYKYNFQYEDAMDIYLNAIEIKHQNNLLYGRLNSDMADILLYQNKLSNAINRYTNAYNFFVKSKNETFAGYTLINIAKVYTLQKKYTNAQKYFNNILISSSDSMLIGFTLQNAGINFYNSGCLDTALIYLRKSINYPYNKNNMAIRLYFLSDLYFDLNLLDSSQMFAVKAFDYFPDIVTQRECYRILANIANEKREISKLKLYLFKYQNLTDSLRNIDKQSNGSDIEKVYKTQQEVAKSRSWISYLSISVLIIIVFSILLYIRKHKKSALDMKIAQEKQIQQKAELRQEVVAKSRKAVETTIKERRDEVMSSLKNNNPEFRRKLLNKLYGEVIHFNDKVYFKKEMDAIMNSLYSKLESRYPELKEKEIQWACLYELNVSRDDIMDLLDFNLESYKKMRQRFAQKTGVQYIKSIDDLLENILTE